MIKSNLSKKAIGNKNVGSTKKIAIILKTKAGKFIDVDEGISAMAKRGELVSAGENAFKRSLKKGLSVTVAEDGAIYRVHPNGTRTRIKEKRVMYRDDKTGRFYEK